MRPSRLTLGVALAATGLLSLAGCGLKKTVQPNVAPHTQLFVQYDASDGGPHDVHHIAHLYWFGSDPDGFVVGYDFRFVWPGVPGDPPWSRTTRTDSVFVIPDTTGVSNPTFEVRAVDDEGVVDPAPPSQSLTFRNEAPVVQLQFPPTVAETTFPTQTIDWSGTDPDGDANLLTFRVWLDGNEANPHVVTGNEFTFPTADFYTGGRLKYGVRTAYVQAVDAGGRPSNIASASWNVRTPVADTLRTRGKLLVIDDVRTVAVGQPGGEGADAAYENFFNAAIGRTTIPANSWTTVKLESGRMFRSSRDLEQSLKLFDVVVWYRGQVPFGGGFATQFDVNRDTLAVRHSDGLAAYLDGGGRFYMESLVLVTSGGEQGLFSLDFMRRYFGSDYLFKSKPFGASDSTVAWPYGQNDPHGQPALLHTAALFGNATLRIAGSTASARLFGVRDPADIVLWANDTTLSVLQTFVAPMAVKSAIGGGGQVVVSTIPAIAAGGPAAGGAFIDKVFQFLGITP